MNAFALKQRIRDRLCHCKFELENLEKAYHKSVNHAKLEKHTTQQLRRKEPGIQALARKHNKLCEEMQLFIATKQAPLGARCPPLIEIAGLFKLDVDDDIWQDIGLTDEVDNLPSIPAWLGNDDVRTGIKALLEHDRCVEEQRRLSEECLSMQQWMLEEWKTVIKALEFSEDDNDVQYHLTQHKQYLLRLCLAWEPLVRIIPCSRAADSWGPTELELMNAKAYEVTENVVYMDDTDEGNLSDDEDSMEAAALVNDLEEQMWAYGLRDDLQ